MHTQSQTLLQRPRRVAALASVGVAEVAVVGAMLLDDRADAQAATDAVELQLPPGGDAFASCLPVTAEHLADMSPAFAGTVTEVTGDRAALRVDHWYAGGGATEVVVSVPEDAHIALNGVIDFREGERYLVTAQDGVVNLCGFSAEATPELEAAFDAAF